jgi:trehalose/maltose hydrolase-like predicted phosphorylase
LNPTSGRWLPDHPHLQRHVNIAIAHNVWQHYMVTGSIGFLRFTDAELLIEIARFWASLATYNTDLNRYEILGVINNNTYTNVMAAWVMLRAIEALDTLPAHYRGELIAELKIGQTEIDRWRDIGAKMRVVFHVDGVLTQFEGYETLREFDWRGYRARYGDILRLDRVLEAEGDSPNNYKLAKQADVLMLLFVLTRSELLELLTHLGYDVTEEQLNRTIEYHLARTAHGSTLSGVVSTWVLARTDPKQAWGFLKRALESDVADVQGGTTAEEGIHLGAMAGTVDIVQRRLTGMRAQGEVLRFDPALPTEVKQIRFSIHYRGHRIGIRLTANEMRVTSRPGTADPIKVLVRGELVDLATDDDRHFALKPAS